MTKKNIKVYVDQDEYDLISKIADINKVSMSGYIRQIAIKQAKEEMQRREFENDFSAFVPSNNPPRAITYSSARA